MQQVHVRQIARLGIERALHGERTAMTLVQDHRATGHDVKAELELCGPAGLELRPGAEGAHGLNGVHPASNSTGKSQVTNTMHPSGLATAWLEPGGLTTTVPLP